MPFKSKAQAGWMFVHKPKMAKKWAEHTSSMKRLPRKVGAKRSRKGKGTRKSR